MAERYDFGAFLRSIEEQDYEDILRSATREVARVEPSLSGVRGAPERRRLGGFEYVDRLKKFLFFMRSGIRPGGLDDHEFGAYRQICERLVERGQFKPSVLDLFRRPGHLA